MICVCVAVGLVGGGGSPSPDHDYACCNLQADCLESGISSGPLCSITSMGNLYLFTPCLSPMHGKTNMAPMGSVGRPAAHCRHNLLVGRKNL